LVGALSLRNVQAGSITIIHCQRPRPVAAPHSAGKPSNVEAVAVAAGYGALIDINDLARVYQIQHTAEFGAENRHSDRSFAKNTRVQAPQIELLFAAMTPLRGQTPTRIAALFSSR
jgi:hypothetical protein